MKSNLDDWIEIDENTWIHKTLDYMVYKVERTRGRRARSIRLWNIRHRKEDMVSVHGKMLMYLSPESAIQSANQHIADQRMLVE